MVWSDLCSFVTLGLPNVQFFPLDTLEAQAARPDRWTPSANHPVAASPGLSQKLASAKLSSDPTAVAVHITVPKVMSESDPVKKIDLSTALQYGPSQGYAPLHSWIKQFTTKHLHADIPYEGGADVILTCGSTDAFFKTLEMFVNPWSEDYDHPEDRPGLLCETFIYGNILGQALPKGMQIVPVKADMGGMCAKGPGGLEDVLSNWDPKNGKRPHLMYTVTLVLVSPISASVSSTLLVLTTCQHGSQPHRRSPVSRAAPGAVRRVQQVRRYHRGGRPVLEPAVPLDRRGGSQVA